MHLTPSSPKRKRRASKSPGRSRIITASGDVVPDAPATYQEVSAAGDVNIEKPVHAHKAAIIDDSTKLVAAEDEFVGRTLCCGLQTAHLAHFDAAAAHPDWNFLTHNPFVLTGYRWRATPRSAFASLFELHNETVNIATHLGGAVIIIALMIHAFVALPAQAAAMVQPGQAPPAYVPVWPLGISGFGPLLCFIASTIYHTFLCLGRDAFKRFLKLDYLGICLFVSLAQWPFTFYGLLCRPEACIVYSALNFASLAGCVIVTLSPSFASDHLAWLRVGVYALASAINSLSVLHVWIAEDFGAATDPHMRAGMWGYLLTMSCPAIGGIFYASRIPERLAPGRFDLTGGSHAIMHVMTVAGAVVAFTTNTGMYLWRAGGGSGECAAQA